MDTKGLLAIHASHCFTLKALIAKAIYLICFIHFMKHLKRSI